MRTEPPESWLARHGWLCAAAALAFLVWLPSLGGVPIWDDVIVLERFLPAFRSFGDAFFPPAGTGELGEYYYRPLVTLSYLWDDYWFGGNAFVGHHVTTVLFHVLATLGVALLTCRLLGEMPGARVAGFAAAALFAVHPVHVESVAQITGRCDPMAAAFLLAALLFLLRGRDRPGSRWPWVGAGAAFLAALFSKEVAVAGIVPAALLLRGPGGPRQGAWWPFVASFGSALLLYFALRASVDLASVGWLDLHGGEAVERLVRAAGFDLKMLVLPIGQAAFVPIDRTPPIWFGGLAVLLFGAAGWLAFAGRRRAPAPWVAWVWFVVTLGPALALVLVKASEQPVAERFLYVPSVGFCVAFGWLVAHAAARSRKPLPVFVATALLVAAGVVATTLRSGVYRDAETFWQDTVAKAPGAALPLYELGVVQRRDGRLDEATVTLERALELYDDAEGRSLAHNTLGTIHLERQQWALAERRFRAAIEERPNYVSPQFNLASVFGMRAETKRDPRTKAPDLADLERCLRALDQTLSLQATHTKARFRLADTALKLTKVYLLRGRRDDAARLRERARAAAQWVVHNLGGTAQAERARAMLNEIQRLPR